MAQDLYGMQYEPTRNESVSVGTSAVVISEQRNSQLPRKVINIRNTSPNATDIITVWFSSAGVATANAGIVLRQFESCQDSSDSGYQAFQDKITAICATATGTVAVFER